jgi:hypothetical protein
LGVVQQGLIVVRRFHMLRCQWSIRS